MKTLPLFEKGLWSYSLTPLMLHLGSSSLDHIQCYHVPLPLLLRFYSEAQPYTFLCWQPAPGPEWAWPQPSHGSMSFCEEHALLSSPALSILNRDYQKNLLRPRTGIKAFAQPGWELVITEREAQCFPPTPRCMEGKWPPKLPRELHH